MSTGILQALTVLTRLKAPELPDVQAAAHAAGLLPANETIADVVQRGHELGGAMATMGQTERQLVVRTFRDSLAAINQNAFDVLAVVRQNVQRVDRFRLVSAIVSALSGLSAAAGQPALIPVPIAGAIACVGAVLTAALPHLDGPGAAGGKTWTEHYASMVSTLAEADGVRRRLTAWYEASIAEQSVSDPEDLVAQANDLCTRWLRSAAHAQT